MDTQRLANWILRIGVAFAFLYPPMNAWVNPYDWIGYFPHGLIQTTEAMGIPDMFVLHAFGVFEILIALWLIWGRYIFWPAAAATLMLLAIVVLNLSNFIVIFRDLSIAAAALALAVNSLPHAFATRSTDI